jgi:hypothetical protein
MNNAGSSWAPAVSWQNSSKAARKSGRAPPWKFLQAIESTRSLKG